MNILEKFDEFKNKKQLIDNQINSLKKKKMQIKLDQFNKKKQEIQKSMNQYVAGASSFN